MTMERVMVRDRVELPELYKLNDFNLIGRVTSSVERIECDGWRFNILAGTYLVELDARVPDWMGGPLPLSCIGSGPRRSSASGSR